MTFRARQFTFTFPRPALIMGIVNVTPDSFSDGGQFLDPGAAVEHAITLAAQGADLVDVGGESTRPGATPVSEAEELRRVLPVIERLAGELKAPISIDTMKPAVAQAALRAGASIVNDVAANRAEPAMWRVVAKAGAGYVAMHMQGTPQNRPLLLGASRKSFLGRFAGATAAGARLPASLACACWAVAQGVNIIRTHEVEATRQALRLTEALLTTSRPRNHE